MVGIKRLVMLFGGLGLLRCAASPLSRQSPGAPGLFPLRRAGRSVCVARSWSPGFSRSGDRLKAGLQRLLLARPLGTLFPLGRTGTSARAAVFVIPFTRPSGTLFQLGRAGRSVCGA